MRVKMLLFFSAGLDSPKNTRVLLTPPADIREGFYVNMSCVSQAHPAAGR